MKKILGIFRNCLTRFRVVFKYFRGLIGFGSGLGRSGMSCRWTRIKFQLKRTILDPFREKNVSQLRSIEVIIVWPDLGLGTETNWSGPETLLERIPNNLAKMRLEYINRGSGKEKTFLTTVQGL